MKPAGLHTIIGIQPIFQYHRLINNSYLDVIPSNLVENRRISQRKGFSLGRSFDHKKESLAVATSHTYRFTLQTSGDK